MDEHVTRPTEPLTARVPNLGRRVAERSAGLAVRRSEALSGAVARRRASRTAADIVPLTVARRPPRPGVTPVAAPMQSHAAVVEHPPASAGPPSPDGQFSDFSLRWMFGDGEVDGIPFADGGALAALAPQERDADPAPSVPTAPEGASAAGEAESGDEPGAEQMVALGLLRGRIEEVSQYRLSRTPPSVVSTESLVPVDPPLSLVGPPAPRAMEVFGPAAHRGAPLGVVDPSRLDDDVLVGDDAVTATSTRPDLSPASTTPRERVPMRPVLPERDEAPKRVPLQARRRRPEIPITFIETSSDGAAFAAAERSATPTPAKGGSAPRAAAKPKTSRPASTKNTAKKRPATAKKTPPTAKGGGAARAAAPRPRANSGRGSHGGAE